MKKLKQTSLMLAVVISMVLVSVLAGCSIGSRSATYTLYAYSASQGKMIKSSARIELNGGKFKAQTNGNSEFGTASKHNGRVFLFYGTSAGPNGAADGSADRVLNTYKNYLYSPGSGSMVRYEEIKTADTYKEFEGVYAVDNSFTGVGNAAAVSLVYRLAGGTVYGRADTSNNVTAFTREVGIYEIKGDFVIMEVNGTPGKSVYLRVEFVNEYGNKVVGLVNADEKSTSQIYSSKTKPMADLSVTNTAIELKNIYFTKTANNAYALTTISYPSGTELAVTDVTYAVVGDNATIAGNILTINNGGITADIIAKYGNSEIKRTISVVERTVNTANVDAVKITTDSVFFSNLFITYTVGNGLASGNMSVVVTSGAAKVNLSTSNSNSAVIFTRGTAETTVSLTLTMNYYGENEVTGGAMSVVTISLPVTLTVAAAA